MTEPSNDIPAAPEHGEHDAEVDALFSGSGALATGIDGFRPRQSQTDMARAVADAIARQLEVAELVLTGIDEVIPA